MALLADENIFPQMVNYLRQKGYDVKSINEEGLKGAADTEVFAKAISEQRALVTFDKHFSNILQYPPSQHYGIVRVRIHPPLLSDILAAFDHLLTRVNLNQLEKTLIILEKEGFRVRRD